MLFRLLLLYIYIYIYILHIYIYILLQHAKETIRGTQGK